MHEICESILEDNMDQESCLPIVNIPMRSIEKVNDISYKEFFENYLRTNQPCLIAFSSIKNWRSKQNWVTHEGHPNFDYLENRFGSWVVPVADCNQREYNSQQKKNMPLKEYICYWKKLNNKKIKNLPCLYLKDWHFFREFPSYKAYETPEYFHSDWLNEFCKTESDDYKFVYMGPKGSWTPLHKDVFGSYSWSVNICGRKRWLMFPPGEERNLKNEDKQLLYSLKDHDLKNILHLEVIQEPDEVLFVPSGWYHIVWNLEDTISINHNWFNGCNIIYIWHCLTTAGIEVEKELSDLKDSKDWEEQCQAILRVHHGFNYTDFLKILKFIFENRSNELSQSETEKLYTWEILFDLISIEKVCSKMLVSKLPKHFKESVVLLQDNVKEFIVKLK